jgi:hypothetical protein
MSLRRFGVLASLPLFLAGGSPFDDAFANGTLHGQVKLFYYNIDKELEEDAHAFAAGGYLKASTDTSRQFFAAVRFHTSHPVGSNKNREKTTLFNNDKDAEALNVNSEAYLGWNGRHRVLRVGNLMLNTPMMNDDTTRIVPWSYQGAAYTGEALPNTKVQLNYIRKIRSHTSDRYRKESASGDIGEGGITMLGIHYKGFEHLALESYYYYAPDLYSTFIAQMDYKWLLDKENLFCASIQYFKSGNGGKYAQKDNRNGGDDIDLIAAKVGYYAEDWMVSLNYSRNFGISGIIKGYGGLAKVFTTSMIANGRGNYGPRTWMVKTRYDFPMTRWGESEIAFTYTHTRADDTRGDDFDAYYAHWKHNFNTDTSLYLRYEALDHHNKGDAHYLRLITSYRF